MRHSERAVTPLTGWHAFRYLFPLFFNFEDQYLSPRVTLEGRNQPCSNQKVVQRAESLNLKGKTKSIEVHACPLTKGKAPIL